jgi:hypothetical protein
MIPPARTTQELVSFIWRQSDEAEASSCGQARKWTPAVFRESTRAAARMDSRALPRVRFRVFLMPPYKGNKL